MNAESVWQGIGIFFAAVVAGIIIYLKWLKRKIRKSILRRDRIKRYIEEE